MNRWLAGVAWVSGMAVVVACGGGAAETPPATGGPAAAGGGDQVATGQKLFAENCASCHGAGGEGKDKAPPVVGKGALPMQARPGSKRTVTFTTVADVAGYVKKNMPPDSPGSLTDDQYWAILAFDLKANGIDLGGKHLDAALAPTLTIPH
jgi:cytochrome c